MGDQFLMVVFIVLIACSTGVANNYLKNKRLENKSREGDLGTSDELNALRERVEVLEKIITDEKYHLSRELDRLERR